MLFHAQLPQSYTVAAIHNCFASYSFGWFWFCQTPTTGLVVKLTGECITVECCYPFPILYIFLHLNFAT